jgi:hypothetical protein
MKDLKFYIAIASIVLVVYLVAQYNRPIPTNWETTLVSSDKIPFGTYVIKHQLNDIFPGAKVIAVRKPIYNLVNENNPSNATYIIIAQNLNINEYDFASLKSFMRQGNNVLLAAWGFGTYITDTLKVATGGRMTTKPIASKFVGRYDDSSKTYAIDHDNYNVYFQVFDHHQATVVGKNATGQPNFIRYAMDGGGALYLNTNPLLFSNYALLQPHASAYAAIALSHLNNNHMLIWDEYYTQGREDDEAIMRVFLRNYALRWAFYLSLASLVIYVLYQMKRRQRIIPILEPLKNTTIDFVTVVGQVYYEQRDNANIAQKKATYFLEHIRNKYGLKTNVLNNTLVEGLTLKSGLEISFIRELIDEITLVRAGITLTDKELISLNNHIEQFYLQTI